MDVEIFEKDGHKWCSSSVRPRVEGRKVHVGWRPDLTEDVRQLQSDHGAEQDPRVKQAAVFLLSDKAAARKFAAELSELGMRRYLVWDHDPRIEELGVFRGVPRLVG